ncbi:hypothetical protein [Anatilimnocola floriformis]|uniref:hypothetical protein n=1 Tax=Anatilimnocola floriformis TaxID=2948575 RepID=UPI0020C54193|nr:hypothetical protein [Anatilimnocola floriformis]
MTQSELDQSVADATGESVKTIRRRGFSIVAPSTKFPADEADEHSLPNVVDWDALELEQRRYVA